MTGVVFGSLHILSGMYKLLSYLSYKLYSLNCSVIITPLCTALCHVM